MLFNDQGCLYLEAINYHIFAIIGQLHLHNNCLPVKIPRTNLEIPHNVDKVLLCSAVSLLNFKPFFFLSGIIGKQTKLVKHDKKRVLFEGIAYRTANMYAYGI